MKKTALTHPDKKFSYGKFSAGIVCDGWLHISGQGPLDMKTGQRVAGAIEEETRLTLQHIETILKEAGADKSAIVKCTCYLADMADFEGFNNTYSDFFDDPLPARTTVQAGLMKSIRVEIDAVARLG